MFKYLINTMRRVSVKYKLSPESSLTECYYQPCKGKTVLVSQQVLYSVSNLISLCFLCLTPPQKSYDILHKYTPWWRKYSDPYLRGYSISQFKNIVLYSWRKSKAYLLVIGLLYIAGRACCSAFIIFLYFETNWNEEQLIL